MLRSRVKASYEKKNIVKIDENELEIFKKIWKKEIKLMSDKILKDEDYGTRDKRGNWKPFGKVPINPPYIVPFQPIKFIKHFFAFPGLIFQNL